MSITHAFSSAKSDGADSTVVQPSDWNASHTIASPYFLPRKTTVTLTNDQIKALPTTAKEIVAAPGSNKAIVPVIWIVDIDTAAGAYTINGGGNFLGIGPGSATGATASDNSYSSFPPDNGLSYGDRFIGVFGMNLGAGAGTDTLVSAANNAGLYIKQNGTNSTGGNAANTMKVTVVYDVLDL